MIFKHNICFALCTALVYGSVVCAASICFMYPFVLRMYSTFWFWCLRSGGRRRATDLTWRHAESRWASSTHHYRWWRCQVWLRVWRRSVRHPAITSPASYLRSPPGWFRPDPGRGPPVSRSSQRRSKLGCRWKSSWWEHAVKIQEHIFLFINPCRLNKVSFPIDKYFLYVF